MEDNSKQIKTQRGYEGRFLTASLVCGFDFLSFFHRLIALHQLLDEQVIKANDAKKFIDDSKKASDALNKILEDTTDEDEMEQFIEDFEKKEEYELRHFLEKIEKEQYEISQCVENLNRIEETEQIKAFWNDTEALCRVAYATDLLEKEKQIQKIDNELKLDVVAGKITPINLSRNGMTFDFIEFYNWAISKGHELPPDINAFLTMSLSEFDEWGIKNNYSPPKRFAIARSKASHRVNVVSQETTEPASSKIIQAKTTDDASVIIHDDGWQDDPTLTKQEKQHKAILAVIASKKYTPMAIPDGEKSGSIKTTCETDYPLIFDCDNSFDEAWKQGRRKNLFRMANHASFAKRGRK
jgi:hypothetical protein